MHIDMPVSESIRGRCSLASSFIFYVHSVSSSAVAPVAEGGGVGDSVGDDVGDSVCDGVVGYFGKVSETVSGIASGPLLSTASDDVEDGVGTVVHIDRVGLVDERSLSRPPQYTPATGFKAKQ